MVLLQVQFCSLRFESVFWLLFWWESSDREFRKKNLSILIDKFITHDAYIATINDNREKKPLLT